MLIAKIDVQDSPALAQDDATLHDRLGRKFLLGRSNQMPG
jgi:hypothetical protein